MRRSRTVIAGLALAFGLAAAPHHLASRTALAPDFVHFESGHVHPVAITPSGERLLVVNTPDNRVTVFDLTGPAPLRIAEIPVGLEPVSVSALSDSEAWVVNHVSDDVSIVNLNTFHTRATLRVGDEPADVVFAGSGPLAYVSVSQEDAVKVYNPATLAQVTTILIDGRMPRALARSFDGSRVFVAVFHAGNRTSVLSEAEAGDSLPPPNPPMNPALPPAPKVALIIQQQAGDWRDETGRLWNAKAKYSSLDTDVAEISTASNLVVRTFSDLGTTNFGIASSPADARVAVTATEARNLVRFEPNVRGHLVDTRAAIIGGDGSVAIANLNPHINYSVTPGPPAEHDSAIGIPTGVAWSADAQRVYVTSLTSGQIAVLDPAGGPNALLARRRTVPGPTGVLADGGRGRLYVVGRFRNVLQTLSAANFSVVAVTPIGMDPTPDPVVNGRKFFYGGFTSGHGDQACATCHLFGDFDNIGWDLGNPQGSFQPPPPGQIDPTLDGFHPMKGPMTTQTLRGLPGTGLLHWRGDRANLDAFNGAFVGLMGRAVPLPDSEMAAFDDFVLPLAYPPNPRQRLDRTMPDGPLHVPSAARGQFFFFNIVTDGPARCNTCHTADNFGPGTNGQVVNNNVLLESQDMKVPQLRNLYRKSGFTDLPGSLNKRGFGYTHNGAIDNLFNFLKFPGFNFGSPSNQTPDENRRDVEAFLLAFDTGMAPAVGFQLTFSGPNNADPVAVARMDTLEGQAGAGHCELVAKGRMNGTPRGWLYQGSGLWKPDAQAEPTITSAALRALGGPGREVTVTGVPVGSGRRMGLDRDRDGYFDSDELLAGSDPGNPASTPANVGVAAAPGAIGLQSVRPNPFRFGTELAFALRHAGKVDCTIYDVMGREVRMLARGQWFEAGGQHLSWDGRSSDGHSAAAGIYFVRLASAEGHWSRMVVRVK